MFKNYLKIALRNLTKQKGLAFINIFGLSVGIACFTLFMLHALSEFNFDRFHKNRNDVYRVFQWSEAKGEERAGGKAYHPMPLGPAMKQDLPGVTDFVRLREARGENFIKANNQVDREEVSFADPSFFSMFSFKVKSGDPDRALDDLHSVVLTEETAQKIFGKTDPVGATIEIEMEDQFVPFTISAIAENPPSNSSIQFKILGNFNYLSSTESGAKRINNWHQFSYQTYLQLKPGSNLSSDKNLLMAFRKKYYPDEEAKSRQNGWKGEGPRTYYGLQPLSSMHTNTKIFGGSISPVNPKTIWILLAIAACVLLIACINFTTLAIGRSASRSKEIGVRKVIGGSRRSLFRQFLTEALLLTFISAILGLLLAKMLLPSFNQLSGRSLNFSFIQFPQLFLLIIGLVLVVGLLAGSYPALLLSRFKPAEVLKTKVRLGGSNFFTRSLVTFQYILSAGLIICTLIMMQQLKYMRSKNPGFNKENVVVVDAKGVSDTKRLYGEFKQKLSAYPEVIGTAGSDLGIGGGEDLSETVYKYNGKDKEIYKYYVDPDYMRVLGLQLMAGRNFDPNLSQDTVNAVIINEVMMNDFGWTLENAVGQEVKGYPEKVAPVVIGVVKNINYRSFSEQIGDQMFHQFRGSAPVKFFVRLKPGNPSAALSVINKTWASAVPDVSFKYDFLDERLNRFYKSEARWSNIVGWAGGISVFLACLGLFGLVALAAVNRTKEIGIRKILGSSVAGIVGLLSKDFVKLIIVAVVIASPIAWYFMHKWLQDFAYRINISWWVFVIAGATALIIALFTVSLQAIKAGIANPVKSLRTE